MRAQVKYFTGLMLTLIMVTLLPAQSLAASVIQLTPAIKASFDETAATAEPSMKGKLKDLYAELAMLQTQYDHREEMIRTLHADNEQALTIIRRDIREIDKAKVEQLEAQTKSFKDRQQPLFDQYSSLNRRISIAKGLKDKTLNKVLQSQADAMKIMVQLAREDIRSKDTVLKAAKEVRSKKISSARQTLAAIESSQNAIKTEKSVASALNTRLSAEWTGFKSSIRKPNANVAAQSLTSMISILRQIATSKQRIVSLEQKVTSVIEKTRSQMGS
ncbi:hypothetical protein [Paenibacillus sp. sgz500958]|uniref:hypothetical protein n=1 Tax=Paenibacillus sp. sgz500958 TaxID=3242475 RepID=UPI0036D362BC